LQPVPNHTLIQPTGNFSEMIYHITWFHIPEEGIKIISMKS
jgi:hypothetical protein